MVEMTNEEIDDLARNISNRGYISIKYGNNQHFVFKKHLVRVLADNYSGSLEQLILEAKALER